MEKNLDKRIALIRLTGGSVLLGLAAFSISPASHMSHIQAILIGSLGLFLIGSGYSRKCPVFEFLNKDKK